ncbi:hypothetical protein NDU88_001114 [Pleurodeles waltl]|uniref:Uncharacterized protein n=1 Tax=Pleurodeles waltl TaxID=8319 RepID=A0AAV7NA15_PLEWA|nr:hypothetical protein NDU88_001114 [Pleurodeles waltl]
MEFRPWRKPPTETATSTHCPPRRDKQTARRSPPTDRRESMYRPPYHIPPIRHLFRGGSPADKNTAATAISNGKRSPPYSPRGIWTAWNPNSTSCQRLSSCSSTRSRNAGAEDNAVLETAVPSAAVLETAVPSSAVLETAVPSAAVLQTAVPSSAVLEMKGPVQRCLRRRCPVQRCLRRRCPV